MSRVGVMKSPGLIFGPRKKGEESTFRGGVEFSSSAMAEKKNQISMVGFRTCCDT